MKHVLALTLSTPRAQVALGIQTPTTGEVQVHSLENLETRRHSEWLLPAIIELLSNSGLSAKDLDGIAVDIGPGSFTGIRVAFQTAQSFAFANGVALFPASSLQILSFGFPKQVRVVAALNAFRNLIYLSDTIDGAGPRVLTSEQACEWLLSAGPIHLVGDAYNRLPEFQEGLKILSEKLTIPIGRDFPSAEVLISMSLAADKSQKSLWTKDWKSIQPLYLRSSEAEEKARLK